MNDWVVFDGHNYEKRVYEVLFPDGEIARAWPNAGTLHIFVGPWKHSGEVLEPDGVLQIRPVPEEDAWTHYKGSKSSTEPTVEVPREPIKTEYVRIGRPPEQKRADFGLPSGLRGPRMQSVAKQAASMARGAAAHAGSVGGAARRSRAQALALASMAGALAGTGLSPVPPPPVCTHSYGLAGGYSSCSMCGPRAIKGEVKR